MSGLFIHGLGAVSPAGWGVSALRQALQRDVPLATSPLLRPGLEKRLRARSVPPPPFRPEFLAHPRLRRASSIAQLVAAAGLEALGDDAALVRNGALRLGLIVCTMVGGVSYSRRFFEEVLREPATASPLIFPETVFNAPASHLAAILGSNGINYSLVGDDGTFLQGLALGAEWLAQGRVDACLVVGAEELDWIVADALRLFQSATIHGAGAGALYLKPGKGNAEAGSHRVVELDAITDSFLFTSTQTRAAAARRMRAQLPPTPNVESEALCLSAQGIDRIDAPELGAWMDWTGRRLAPKRILGEAFAASAAWQCVTACDAVRTGKHPAVNVSVVGANQQAIGARFVESIAISQP